MCTFVFCRQQHGMILSYSNILAVILVYNLFQNATQTVHLDTVIDQISWISILFKKCGAKIETKGWSIIV